MFQRWAVQPPVQWTEPPEPWEPFRARCCDTAFPFIGAYLYHCRQRHSVRPFPCNCGEVFWTEASRSIHQEIDHTLLMGSSSGTVTSRVKWRAVDGLRKHIAWHQGKYTCFCGRPFGSGGSSLDTKKPAGKLGILVSSVATPPGFRLREGSKPMRRSPTRYLAGNASIASTPLATGYSTISSTIQARLPPRMGAREVSQSDVLYALSDTEYGLLCGVIYSSVHGFHSSAATRPRCSEPGKRWAVKRALRPPWPLLQSLWF